MTANRGQTNDHRAPRKFDQTHLFTFLSTSFWFALVRVDDSDTSDFIRHTDGLFVRCSAPFVGELEKL